MKKGFYVFMTTILILSMAGCSNAQQSSILQESEDATLSISTSDIETVTGPERRTTAENNGNFNLENATVQLNSGYEMPIVGLGAHSLSADTCRDSFAAFIENGGRLIDTASYFGAEESIREAIESSGVPREELFITANLYMNRYKDADAAIDELLAELGISYIDLMMLHHPAEHDVEAYLELEQAVSDGRIRSIGLSNWYIKELEEFLPQVNMTPALIQNEIHPYYQENEVIPYIHNLGAAVSGWFPFGGAGHTKEVLGNPVISAIAVAHQVTPEQVIIRWNLQKGVVAVPSTRDPEQIAANLDVFSFELSDNEMEQLNALDRNEKHELY